MKILIQFVRLRTMLIVLFIFLSVLLLLVLLFRLDWNTEEFLVFLNSKGSLSVFVFLEIFVAGLIVGLTVDWVRNETDRKNKEQKQKENKKINLYKPFLRCLLELDIRFKRILDYLGEDWLAKKYLDNIKKKSKNSFVDNPREKGYFILSSIYLIASLFGFLEAVRKDVEVAKYEKKNFKKKLLRNKKKKTIQLDSYLEKIFLLFQNPKLFENYKKSNKFTKVKDTHFKQHIQNAVGEMMIKTVGKDDGVSVKSFREFYDDYIGNKKFSFWFFSIEDLFSDLSNFSKNKDITIEKKSKIKNDIRPLRIIAIQYWCRVLMQEIELNLYGSGSKKYPDEALGYLSDDLKELIKNY